MLRVVVVDDVDELELVAASVDVLLESTFAVVVVAVAPSVVATDPTHADISTAAAHGNTENLRVRDA